MGSFRQGGDHLRVILRQVCHVAAQYGQAAFLYHVALRWDADVDSPDADGRTPLHWAAYKGFGDTIRLLLVMDSHWALADREGCTPLHWAAIRGNAEACTLLLQARRSCLPTLPAVRLAASRWQLDHQGRHATHSRLRSQHVYHARHIGSTVVTCPASARTNRLPGLAT